MPEITYTTSIADVDWSKLTTDLERDNFHNGRIPEELKASFNNSGAVAFAWRGDRVIGKARALTDQVCNAYVVDVWTSSAYRRQGIASKLMKLLENQLNGQHVFLFTDDAQKFYTDIGYEHRGVGYERVVGEWLNRSDPKE